MAGAVHHLCLNTAVRPSGIKAEHIWAWLRASNRKDLPYPLKWDMDIGLIQAAFREGDLAEECAWKTVVPIPKGNGNFRGIGLVEILWKTVTGILNRRLTATIQFSIPHTDSVREEALGLPPCKPICYNSLWL